MEFLNLSPFPEAQLTLYSDPFDPASEVATWSTNNPSEAFFRDPGNGEVEFYLTATQTTAMSLRQYTMRSRLIKDPDHVYTVYEGVLEVRA